MGVFDQTHDVLPQSPRAFVTPETLGPYRLLKEIGRGSNGVVFEADNMDTSARVALKVLRHSDPEGVARFKDEVRRVANLRQPNLLIPFELVTADGFWCFSMELVNGCDLMTYVKAGATTAERIQRIEATFPQLGDAIAALHSERLLHLDLKPANVLVREDGHVYVLDFGIARPLAGSSRLRSGEHGLVGTPGYWSPEQAEGRRPLPESDWYAIGVMLYEALTGELPLGNRSPSKIAKTTPLALDELCAGLLARDPRERKTGIGVLRHHRESREAAPSLEQPRLLGRDAELAIIDSALERVRSGVGVSVLVTGVSGIGKSALIDRFLESLERTAPEVVVVSGRCHERERLPYKGFDSIIDSLADRILGLPESSRQAFAVEGLDEATLIFPTLGRLGRPSKGVRPREDPGATREKAFHAVRELIAQLGRRLPLILFLDDVHWADPDTANLFSHVFAGPDGPRALLLLTFRTGDGEGGDLLRGWPKRIAAACNQTIHLSALDPRTAGVLAARFGADDARATEIAEAAQGNPFLIEELARHWGHRSVGRQDLLAKLVEERMKVLSANSQHLLLLTALAGRPIEQEIVLSAGRMHVVKHEVLAELRRLALVRTCGPEERKNLEVWHDRIRRAVIDLLPPERVAVLHGELAHSLEQYGGSPSELAHHFRRSGDLPRTLRYLTLAADHARAALAFERAADFYAQAMDLGIAEAGPRADLAVGHAESLFNAGHCSDAAPAFLQAARHQSPVASRQSTMRALEAWLLAGRIEEGFEVLEQLSPSLGQARRGGFRTAISLVRQLAELLTKGTHRTANAIQPAGAFFDCDLCWALAKGLMYVTPLQATDFLLRSLLAAGRAGDRARIARCLGLVGAGMFMQVPFLAGKGAAYLAQSAAIAREIDEPYLIAMAEVWGAFSEVYPGRWRVMLDRSERGVALLSEKCTGVAWETAIGQGIRAWAWQFLGELAASRACAMDGLRSATQRGDLYAEVLFSQYVCYAELAAGEQEQARERISNAVEKWTKRQYTVQHFYATVIVTMGDLLSGQPEHAARRLAEERPSFTKSGGTRAPMSRIDHAVLEARISLNLDERSAMKLGLRPLAKISAELERETRADCPGHAAAIRGGAASRSGDREGALRHWRLAERTYARADMALHSACAQLRRAEIERNDEEIEHAGLAIRACGVADPRVWSRAFMPAGRPS